MVEKSKAIVLGVAHPHIYQIAGHVLNSQRLALCGVYDEDVEAAQLGGQRLGVSAMGSLDEALSAGSVLALIGAEPKDRAGLAVACLERGIAALVDKPLALSTGELARLRTAAERSRSCVVTYYPLRAMPLIREAVAAVRAGRIGRVTRVDAGGSLKLRPMDRPQWHFTRAGNGGALIDMGAHYFDLCCWVADSPMRDVSASHVNFSQPQHPEFQDAAQACLQFDNGVLGQVSVDWLLPDSAEKGDTRLTILGTTGRIEVRVGDMTMGRLWTQAAAGTDLQPDASDAGAWGVALVEALAFGEPTEMTQEQVFSASQAALQAFDVATSRSA